MDRLVLSDSLRQAQRGITFFLTDLDAPGVTVRPILNLAGDHEFNEVFFDNVRVPRASIVGEVNQGWTIAKALLGAERLFIGSPGLPRLSYKALIRLGDRLGVSDVAAFSTALTRHAADLHSLEVFYREVSEMLIAGNNADVELSMLKIVSSELYQRISETIIDFGGDDAVRGKDTSPRIHNELLDMFYVSRPTTIYGGTNEVHRNILSKAWLQLP